MSIIQKSIQSIVPFLAGDETHLREVLHPKNDGIALPYSVAHASLNAGACSLAHTLESTEVYYILEGEGVIYIDGKAISLKQGHLVVVPPLAHQYVENTGQYELLFLCIVSPAWQETEEIIFDK